MSQPFLLVILDAEGDVIALDVNLCEHRNIAEQAIEIANEVAQVPGPPIAGLLYTTLN